MCNPGQQPDAPSATFPAAVPQSAGEAMGMVLVGLGWLAAADLASVPASVRAECLRQLEQARSVQTAAHAAVLSAFDYDGGYADDGQGSSGAWLRWQTQVTGGAAAGAVGWMRRLRAHPAVAAALRAARISESWAKQICAWTDLLPESARQDADAILLAAAAGGAELADLASLADQMRRTLARPDEGDDDGFEDRQLRLATTIGGAGKLTGDLTPGCAAALAAVLDALGKKAGPEDLRTERQRHHDALEEACRRLIGSGCVPDRAGQPTRIQLHMSLEDLARRLAGGTAGGTGPEAGHRADPGWADVVGRLWPRLTPGATPAPEPVPWPAAAPGQECDARIVPVVTGRVDHDLLDKLTAQLHGHTAWSQQPGCDPGRDGQDTDRASRDGAGTDRADRDAVRDLILANAVALLSGPGQLASVLRTGALPPPAAGISLPLDVGTATDTIPAHLRRAVILRDKHCSAPGCQVPPAGCQVHHIIPRSRGGPTSLGNIGLYCSFHHLIVIHRWGWTVTLNPDGTTTMASPDGTRVLHSHSPPSPAAA
jgi:hypothetical protein